MSHALYLIKTHFNRLTERIRGKGFMQDGIRAAIQRKCQWIIVMKPSAAGHGNNIGLETSTATDLKDRLDPFLARHDDIHQDNVKTTPYQGRQGKSATINLGHIVSFPLHDDVDQTTQLGVVINDQNRFGGHIP